MSEFKRIPNPYIVGNPIKSKEMFYGRQDDFDFVKRKLEAGGQSFVIVFCGERRSGKTSILFQILNGELGEGFLPILVDMQTMAGLKNDGEFFEKVAKETIKCLKHGEIDLNDYDFMSQKESPYKAFDKLLDEVQTLNAGGRILFLIDEYELIESKIDEGSLSANFVPFLAGLLEGDRNVSYILTGSTRLDVRESKYWSIMLPKSLYRNVSFLTERDTLRLITEPVVDYVSYEDDSLDAIRRLTAGQPFYTQVVCQNLVDHLNDREKNHVNKEDVRIIADEIIENPLPQMIYFYNSLSNNKKIVLSLLAEMLTDENAMVGAKQVQKHSKKRDFGIHASLQAINTTLDNLYKSQFVNKTSGSYNFKIDIFRGWIKREHSIWSVIKDVGSELTEEVKAPVTVSSEYPVPGETGPAPEKRRPRKWPAVIVVVALLGILITQFLPELKERILPGIKQLVQGTPPVSKSEIKTEAPSSQSDEQESAGKAQKSAEMTKEQNSSKQAKTSFEPGLVEDTGKEETAEHTPDLRESPASQTDLFRRQAINWRDKMTSAKTEAEGVSAATLAAKSFNSAQQKEDDARDLFSKRQFQMAAIAYQDAQQLYSSAAAEARTASANLAAEAEELRNGLQSIKGKLNEQYVFLNEYQQAVKAEKDGASQLQSGDTAAAIQGYKRAEQLYEAAITVREEQIKKIRSVIDQYGHALESKDLQLLRSLYVNFTKELETRWSQVFKNVDNIEAQLSIQKFNFNEDGVTISVDVHLKYSDSDNRYPWQIQLTETNKTWLITNISAGG